MRKLSLLLVLCLLLVGFASCNENKDEATSTADQSANTTQTEVQSTDAPTEEKNDNASQTPQDKWTGRY